MERKEFIQKVGGILLVGVPAFILIGCSSSDDSSSETPGEKGETDCLKNGATASGISANHGHTLVVSKADISAASEKSYSIKGSSNHNHNITLSANNFATLKTSKIISVTSSTDGGHSHSVTVTCA
ncbi:MAG: hypothetical protein V3U92_17835 [Cellulophaga sp.]